MEDTFVNSIITVPIAMLVLLCVVKCWVDFCDWLNDKW